MKVSLSLPLGLERGQQDTSDAGPLLRLVNPHRSIFAPPGPQLSLGFTLYVCIL